MEIQQRKGGVYESQRNVLWVLRKGHMSSNCQRHLICQICNTNHPKVLHIDRKEDQEKSNESKVGQIESKESSLSSALVSMDAGSHTGAGTKDCALAIIPVKVKFKKQNSTDLCLSRPKQLGNILH